MVFVLCCVCLPDLFHLYMFFENDNEVQENVTCRVVTDQLGADQEEVGGLTALLLLG